MNAYQVTGLTKVLAATTTSSVVSISPGEAGIAFNGQTGPLFLKITNGSASDNVYFSTGKTSQTAVKPVVGTPGSCPIPAYGEVIIQVGDGPSVPPVTIYVAAVADTSATVYVTPVLNLGARAFNQ